jgi:hypothetical protein
MLADYNKWVIPKEGLVVRDPRTYAPLPEIGMLKPWTGPEGRYWRRRVKFGDVVLGEAPAKPKIEKVEKEKKVRRK